MLPLSLCFFTRAGFSSDFWRIGGLFRTGGEVMVRWGSVMVGVVGVGVSVLRGLCILGVLGVDEMELLCSITLPPSLDSDGFAERCVIANCI